MEANERRWLGDFIRVTFCFVAVLSVDEQRKLFHFSERVSVMGGNVVGGTSQNVEA